MGNVKMSRWPPPSLSVCCQLLAIERSQAPEIPEKFVGEKRKIKKGVAVNSQWFVFAQLGGKPWIPFAQSKIRMQDWRLPPAFQRSPAQEWPDGR